MDATIMQKFVGDKDNSKIITVDTYCQRKNIRPTHIKIDIEGYEMFALHGMKKTLERYKPKMFIEFHEKIITERLKFSQHDVNNFFKLLREYGYNIIFNGHHYEMSTSIDKLYNFVWHSTPPNNVNYACIAECSSI